MSLRKLLKDDIRYNKVLNRLKNFDAKVEPWQDELLSMHSQRSIRALNTTALLQSSQHIVIDGNLENQAVRSRCTGILMHAEQKLAIVDENIDALRKYITSKYGSILKETYSTVTDRKSVVDAALQNVLQVKKRLQSVTKLAEILINDVDAAGYTLKRIGDVLAMKAKDR